jgi:hypothetical protein
MYPKSVIICTFFADFSPNFKHVVRSRLEELLSLPYMVEKLEMFSFQPSLYRRTIPPVALDMT